MKCSLLLVLVCFSAYALCAMPSSVDSDVIHVIPETPALALQSVNTLVAASPNIACTYSASGGSWDLTPLIRATGDYKGTDGTYDYKMNVCSKSNAGTGCTDKDYAICQFSQAGGTFVASLGSFAAPPTWSVIMSGTPPAPEPTSAGVQYTLTNGDICWIAGRQQVRTVTCVFRCSSGATEETVKVEEDQTTCTFIITLKTPVSCPGGASGSTGGLSGGSVFLIIFVSIIPLYIGIGCLFNWRKKGTAPGMESMPNVEFWRGLPGLVVAGCKYTWNMTRSGCKSGKADDYNPL